MSTAVATILQATSQHRLRDRPADRYSDASVFECSCGQVFVPYGALRELPHNVPTLAAVHLAEAVTLALFPSPDARRTVSALRGVAALPIFSVLRDATGAMMRLRNTYGGTPEWVTQTGRVLSSDEIALPATLVWTTGDQG